MKDLILAVADKNMHFAFRGILNRPEALGIRRVTVDFLVHPGRDGGMRKTGPELLSLKRATARHGLAVLDYEGSGATEGAILLEKNLITRIEAAWGDCGSALVIEPELDVWTWGGENALKDALGWNRAGSIREWLAGKGYVCDERSKPVRPKEALEAVLCELRRPRSSALYEDIAGKLSFRRCIDPAFCRLVTLLQRWFPV